MSEYHPCQPADKQETLSKRYDIFISYARADRRLVQAIARALRAKRVRVWIDAWEMQPGDVLRDRINAGIAGADYTFLIIASPTSLASNSVKHELTSGMLLEIEAGDVRVIAAICKGVDFSDLPTDFRAKHSLDFGTTRSRQKGSGSVAG